MGRCYEGARCLLSAISTLGVSAFATGRYAQKWLGLARTRFHYFGFAPENLLTQLSLMEQTVGTLPLPVCFLRPAWFMENAAWDLPSARDAGVIPNFLQPLDRKIPMVGTADVGRVAAIASGSVSAPHVLRGGALAVFAPSNEPVEFEVLSDTEFVLGSAAPHEHDLVTGYYSVHTLAHDAT